MQYKVNGIARLDAGEPGIHAYLSDESKNTIELLITKDNDYYVGEFVENSETKYIWKITHSDITNYYTDKQLTQPIDANLVLLFADLINHQNGLNSVNYIVARNNEKWDFNAH